MSFLGIKIGKTRSEQVYRCSFCGKNREQVFQVIKGPGGVGICDECIQRCSEIIQERKELQEGQQK